MWFDSSTGIPYFPEHILHMTPWGCPFGSLKIPPKTSTMIVRKVDDIEVKEKPKTKRDRMRARKRAKKLSTR